VKFQIQLELSAKPATSKGADLQAHTVRILLRTNQRESAH